MHLLTVDQWLNVLYQSMAAAVIGPAFAMLFAVPARFLALIAAVSALTRGARAFLVLSGMEMIIATFIACAICSLIFIYFGPRLRVPRPVFTVPCIISMIPGLDAYNALLALIHIIESTNSELLNHNIAILFRSGMNALGIVFAIAVGLAVPPLFFYKYRHTRL